MLDDQVEMVDKLLGARALDFRQTTRNIIRNK